MVDKVLDDESDKIIEYEYEFIKDGPSQLLIFSSHIPLKKIFMLFSRLYTYFRIIFSEYDKTFSKSKENLVCLSSYSGITTNFERAFLSLSS